MEQAAVSFIGSLGHLGEGFLFVTGVLIILAFVVVKALPMIEKWGNKRIEIEAKREERKADEVATRAQRDRERSEMEGRWLAQYEHATKVQEQTNTITEGVREQMMLLNQALTDSKNRSQEMSTQVQEIHHEIVDRDK